MSNYFLPPHVHFCRRGDAFVFVDLKRDDYLLVNGALADALDAHCMRSAQDRAAPVACEELRTLLKGGLLTLDGDGGRTVAPTTEDVALEPLVDPDLAFTSRPTLENALNFAAACFSATLTLSRNRIEDTVRGIQRSRPPQYAMRLDDLNLARELTSVFQKLRFYFPMNHLCLYESLALLKFLARYQIFPNWVFGVRLEPWAAHCWIQSAGYIFNEDPEKASGFTPIMIV